jgi:hypothetical protein
MKGLILFGSPHLKGKTNKILAEVLNSKEGLIDFKRSNLLKKEIHHCIGCNQCNTGDFSCIYDDDMVEIYKAIEASDVIILATPIYFNSVTSIMKLIGTAGSKLPNSFESFLNVADYFFLSVNGTIEKTLFINGTDQKDYFNRQIDSVIDMKKFLCNITKD